METIEQIACVLAVLIIFFIIFIFFDSRIFKVEIWVLRQWRSERISIPSINDIHLSVHTLSGKLIDMWDPADPQPVYRFYMEEIVPVVEN